MILEYFLKNRREICMSQGSLNILNWFSKMSQKTHTPVSAYEGSWFPQYFRTLDNEQLLYCHSTGCEILSCCNHNLNFLVKMPSVFL